MRQFILFQGKRHPGEMGEAEVSEFLTFLATKKRGLASTQNQAFAALLFPYRDVLKKDFGWLENVERAKKPARLPVVFTKQEVNRILSQLEGTTWLMASLLYGAGLRVMECHRLRVKDLDFECNQISVREGKGEKDRVTKLADTGQQACSQEVPSFAFEADFPEPLVLLLWRSWRHGGCRPSSIFAIRPTYP